jgi:hypothetical protein
MSKLIVKPNDSGIGEVKITGPNTNSTRYQLLPDVSGNVVVSDGSLLTVSQGGNSLNFGGATKLEGAVQGLHKWEIVNSNTTLTINRNYFANTRGQSDLTLTLPASANVGDTIQVIDNEGFCSSNNIFIANGTSTQTIDGDVRKLTLATDRESVKLFYTGSSWISKQQETQVRFSGAQGEVSGYNSGGQTPTKVNTIDKFPFATDTNATDVGDLSQTRSQTAGQSSTVSGYTSGGNDPSPAVTDRIDKFPFASDSNATDVGNLTQARRNLTGQSSSVSGYNSGGATPPVVNTIDKFPFATDSNATDVGDLTQTRRHAGGQSSTVSGYTSGGFTATDHVNTIDKFPFVSDSNATDVGNLTQVRQAIAGQQH